jgi:hypothetical protein
MISRGRGADAAAADRVARPSRGVLRTGAVGLTALGAALLAAAGIVGGCGARGRDVAERTTVASPTPVVSPSRTRAVTSRARALEVIRTRIADKANGSAVDEPSPSGQPPLKVEVGDDGIARARGVGLQWTRRPAGLFDLEDARAYCDGLEVAGEAAWRLPRIEELETIVRADPTICGAGGSLELWSATSGRERGNQILGCRGMTRSRRTVGMAHVVCVMRSKG